MVCGFFFFFLFSTSAPTPELATPPWVEGGTGWSQGGTRTPPFTCTQGTTLGRGALLVMFGSLMWEPELHQLERRDRRSPYHGARGRDTLGLDSVSNYTRGSRGEKDDYPVLRNGTVAAAPGDTDCSGYDRKEQAESKPFVSSEGTLQDAGPRGVPCTLRIQ